MKNFIKRIMSVFGLAILAFLGLILILVGFALMFSRYLDGGTILVSGVLLSGSTGIAWMLLGMRKSAPDGDDEYRWDFIPTDEQRAKLEAMLLDGETPRDLFGRAFGVYGTLHRDGVLHGNAKVFVERDTANGVVMKELVILARKPSLGEKDRRPKLTLVPFDSDDDPGEDQ